MSNFLEHYFKFLKIVLTILMGVLLIPVTMQIVSRYVDIVPRYIWTEELARFCFIWIILVGAMIAMREDEHFTVDLLPSPKTNKGKALSLMFVDLMSFTMAMVFVVWGWPLVKFGLLQSSEMADMPMIFIYAAWPITGVTWLLFLTERVTDHIKLYRSSAP